MMTLTQAIELAKKITNRAAGTKDWRLTNKRDRGMKDLAVELSQGKGYILASPKSIAERYPQFVGPYFAGGPDAGRTFVWAIDATYANRLSFRRRTLSFVPVR